MIAPARVAALRVLQAVDADRADLPAAIAQARTHLADERDRALLVELATGTLRWLGAIDHLIAHAAKRPVARLDPEVRDVLRLGIYQLLHLDRVPASAVVDDAVELTRKAGKSSAAGFVNAVLRGISRTRSGLPLPPKPALGADGVPGDREGALDYLSTTLSHPRWLVARWMDAHGFAATERWARFNNDPAPLTMRANTLRTTRAALQKALAAHGVECRPTAVAPDGLVVTAGNPLHTPLAESGLFVLQDEASQAVASLALAAPGERVLDTCASPGGKSVAMAAAVGPDGLVVAGDIRSRRIDLLRQTLTRAGAGRASVVQIDLGRPLPFGPCSIASSWMRRARGSARFAASRRYGGGVRPAIFLRSQRRSSACWAMQPRQSGPVDGSCTPPAPASRKRTRPWSPLSSPGAPNSRGWTCTSCCTGCPHRWVT